MFSPEDALLETGGGVAHALPLLGDSFFVVNGDVLWLDGAEYALARLAAHLRPRAAWMRCCCCSRTTHAVGYDGDGDYFLDPLGLPRRRGEREIAPFIFAGIQMLHRRLFDGDRRAGLLAQPALRQGDGGGPAARHRA